MNKINGELVIARTIINLQYFLEVQYMLAIPELAMPRSRKVTTVCNGKREV